MDSIVVFGYRFVDLPDRDTPSHFKGCVRTGFERHDITFSKGINFFLWVHKHR